MHLSSSRTVAPILTGSQLSKQLQPAPRQIERVADWAVDVQATSIQFPHDQVWIERRVFDRRKDGVGDIIGQELGERSGTGRVEIVGWQSPVEIEHDLSIAKVSRRQAGASALWKFIDGVFRGDPQLMLEHLIEGDRLDAKDLGELRKLIEARRKELDP